MFPYKIILDISAYAVLYFFPFLAAVFFPPFLALFPYFASSWAKKSSISFFRSLFLLWGGGGMGGVGKTNKNTKSFYYFPTQIVLLKSDSYIKSQNRLNREYKLQEVQYCQAKAYLYTLGSNLTSRNIKTEVKRDYKKKKITICSYEKQSNF